MHNADEQLNKLKISHNKPLVIVISGPSGAGKDAVLDCIKKSGHKFAYITTVTTRKKRANEQQMKPYNFVSEDEFHRILHHEGFLEWAEVYGNWYGVPKGPVKEALDKDTDIIIKVDVQGAATIKKVMPEALFIFIVPPSLDDLAARLSGRKTESPDELSVRLQTAADEIQQIINFDYVVFNRNNELDRTLKQILAIITAEKCRVNPRQISL